MKKILSLTAIIACLSTTAFGGSYTNDESVTNGALAASGAVAGAVSGSRSSGGDAVQGQRQGQVGVNASDIDNTSKVKGSGNSDVGIKNGISIDTSKTIHNKPSVKRAYAPVVIPTSDCLGAISAGGQGQFVGLTFGKTTQSNPCNVREFAKMNIHDAELFYAIQCQDPIVKEAFKVTGDYNRYCVGAKAKTKSKWFGLNTVKAYEEICAYPTEECKRYKKYN